MNFIKLRLITLRTKAQALRTSLRRYALFADTISPEFRAEVIARFTPAERAQFEQGAKLTKERLRSVAVHVETLRKWFDFLLEKVEEQFQRAQTFLDQGRAHECLAVLADIEWRVLHPNRDTLAFVIRTLEQRAGQRWHQKLLALDALIRDLYLPTAKIAHQRGLIPKEALARTPLAYLADASDGCSLWRQHTQAAAVAGRQIPITLMAIPVEHLADPWNLVAIAHEVGMQLYQDLSLGYEFAHKLLRESPNAGVSPQTAPIWSRWHETLFADVFATLRMGPAYVTGMIELMVADPRAAIAWSPDSPVPPPYLRWHVMLQAMQLLGFAEEARTCFSQIHSLCGDPNQLAQTFGPIWLQMLNEARAVAGLIAFSPCQKLGGSRVFDLVPPHLPADAQQVQRVKDILLAGDETCVRDEECLWADNVRDVPAHLALAGLRIAHDATEDLAASRKLWVRFWCMMQLLTQEASPGREREDREFAPNEAALKSFAERAVPLLV